MMNTDRVRRPQSSSRVPKEPSEARGSTERPRPPVKSGSQSSYNPTPEESKGIATSG
jgi:polo-like kinase 1